MKKLGIIFMACVVLFSITACSKGESKKLIMATSADYYPYEFIDTASGSEETVGFDIDVAKLIAAELGFEFEIINMDFGGLLGALQAGQADFVLAGMTPNEERAKNVDFSKVYYDSDGSNAILALKTNEIKTVEDLQGRKIAAQLGSAQEQAAKKITGTELVLLNKIPEMVQEVLAGRVDAIIIEETAAQKYVENYTDLEYTPYSSEGLNGIAVAFPKGSDKVEQFNKAIDKLKETGKLDELVEKWKLEESK